MRSQIEIFLALKLRTGNICQQRGLVGNIRVNGAHSAKTLPKMVLRPGGKSALSVNLLPPLRHYIFVFLSDQPAGRSPPIPRQKASQMISNILYLIGSLCFALGTILNMLP
jgi:hypothetical protein